MPLTGLWLENFTVFDKLDISFSPGINVFIGENGIGKTHILKILYSACQASQAETTALRFNQKLVRVFRPDKLMLSKLIKRGGLEDACTSTIEVYADNNSLFMYFQLDTNTWEANIQNEKQWEKQSDSLVSIFIPAKEILSNAQKLTYAIDQSIVAFDDTYKDIVQVASIGLQHKVGKLDIPKYAKILNQFGILEIDILDEVFYLKQDNQDWLEFVLVSEGIRKIALLWQLIKIGSLTSGSILFWDEPEASINPMNYPIIAEILLELQRDGIQIFLATHDYFLSQYLDVRKNNKDNTQYYVLYKKDSIIQYEKSSNFDDLQNNIIIDQSISLYEEEVMKVMG
jgi:predicted ATP-dependent endonuclease of OLD family